MKADRGQNIIRKILRLLPWFLLAAGLLAYLAIGTAHGRRKVEIARAAEALQNLHQFLFDRSIVQDVPFPATLDDVPEWRRLVENIEDLRMRALCRKIVYACDPAAIPDNLPLAAIDLDRTRVVLLSGGAVFAVPIRSCVELPLAPCAPEKSPEMP